MASAQVVSIAKRPLDPALDARWAAVVTHTHNMRVRQVPFHQAKTQLLQWCEHHRVRALGLGSPWEPVSAESYGRYEGPERDRYYAGRIDPASVMDREAIDGLISELNRRAPRTLFYLDNETPKARYGHLWWFGWHYDAPAWHDYSQDRPITYHDDDPEREINPLTGQPHRRRPYLEVVAAQRKRGALAVWAHPTSWWTMPIRRAGTGDSMVGAARQEEAFVTNIAVELPLHLLADGRLDGLAVMGYDACHRPYQALWWSLLDRGVVVPGFAETDSCFDRSNLLADPHALVNRFPVGERPTLEQIVAAARAGRGFATSGPFLTLAVDGCAMGGVVASGRGQRHRAVVEAHPAPGEAALARVDLIGRGGAVLASVERFAGGAIEFAVDGDDAAWVVARAWGERDDPANPRQKEIRHHALSNPVYLRAGGPLAMPMLTDLSLAVRSNSPWLGGELRFEDAGGELLERGTVAPGVIARRLPVSARATLTAKDGATRTFYLAMEHRAAQARLRHLWAGGFRVDQPSLRPGEVPPELFAIDALRGDLATTSYAI